MSPKAAVASYEVVMRCAVAGPGVGRPDVCQHLHVVGATGSGKSTLVLNLVLADAAAGRGVVLLDPKGDLVRDVLDRLPAEDVAGGAPRR